MRWGNAFKDPMGSPFGISDQCEVIRYDTQGPKRVIFAFLFSFAKESCASWPFWPSETRCFTGRPFEHSTRWCSG